MNTSDYRSAPKADLAHQALKRGTIPSTTRGRVHQPQQEAMSSEDLEVPSAKYQLASKPVPGDSAHSYHVGPNHGAALAIPRLALSELTDPFQQKKAAFTSLAETVPPMPKKPREIKDPRNALTRELSQFNLVIDEREIFQTERNDARFEGCMSSLGSPTRRQDRGLTRSELLPGKLVAEIVEWLARSHVGRNQSQVDRWRRLITRAARNNGEDFGYFEWGAGGTRSLANALSVPQKSISRSIKTWTDRGLVRPFWSHGQGGRNLVGLHVPALTEWLVWLSRSRYEALYGPGSHPTIFQVTEVMRLAIACGAPVPPSLGSRDATAQLIVALKSESMHLKEKTRRRYRRFRRDEMKLEER
jgi:hypothetical protein